MSTKVEIQLKKLIAGIKWNQLEGEESNNNTLYSSLENNKPPSYPTSSKNKIDWDKIEVKEEDKEDDFLKKLFKDSDEDTRKAMIKSYTESNGTCLSTN